MLTNKKGMSAVQIMRFMGFGSYKTAWGMCHKIRAALVEPQTKLGGIVEADETFIGRKAVRASAVTGTTIFPNRRCQSLARSAVRAA